jgi:hypothetical protein
MGNKAIVVMKSKRLLALSILALLGALRIRRPAVKADSLRRFEGPSDRTTMDR